MKAVGLIRFLKGTTDVKAGMPGCANYDRLSGDCLLGKKCKVEQGKRCSYFERAVLPTGDENVRQQYEDLTSVYVKGIAANLCGDCRARIPPGRRYCDNCRRKRRQATYRRNRDKRNVSCATVN